MINKILLSAIMVLFLAACSTTPKDDADSKGTGSSSSSSDVSGEGAITETEGTGVVSGSQEDLIVNVGDRVFFDYDQSRFKNEGVETLKRQAKFLLKNLDLTVRIEGHCDQRGTREYNLALGERRAFSVKSFLVSLGVEESRISVISYGKEKPQSSGENETSWAQNRTAITVINQ